MNQNENKNLEKDILNTVNYFDIFNFPLTSFEIWKNLYSKNKTNLKDILEVLDNSEEIKNKINVKESLYFLKGREEIINKRKNNYIASYNKYKKGIKFIKLISNFHSIKSVFMANSLSIDNGRDDSDIDLFVVSRKNTIWFSRFISVFLAQTLGLRPTDKTKKDKICLTIFIDENHLNLKKVCSKNDIYYIYWINQVLPIFDPSNIYKKFIKENNWAKENISNMFEYKTGYKRTVRNIFLKKVLRKITKIFSIKFFEKISKNIELKMFPKDIINIIKDKNSEDIFVDDTMIKLHNNNNRNYFHNLFLERIK